MEPWGRKLPNARRPNVQKILAMIQETGSNSMVPGAS